MGAPPLVTAAGAPGQSSRRSSGTVCGSSPRRSCERLRLVVLIFSQAAVLRRTVLSQNLNSDILVMQPAQH
jgi:hypothetical protein